MDEHRYGCRKQGKLNAIKDHICWTGLVLELDVTPLGWYLVMLVVAEKIFAVQ